MHRLGYGLFLGEQGFVLDGWYWFGCGGLSVIVVGVVLHVELHEYIS